MGDTLRDLLPSRNFLSLDQLRQIFKNQHKPQVFVRLIPHARPFQPDRNQLPLDIQLSFQVQIVALIGQHPVISGLERVETELLEHLIGRLSSEPVGSQSKDALGRWVEGGDRSAPIDRQKTGGDRIDDRFDIGPAAIQLDIGVPQSQVGLLKLRFTPLQILRHPIERLDQRPNFIGRLGIDLHRQVALGDCFGRFRQPLNRNGDPTRHIEPEPRCAEENQHCHDGNKKVCPGFNGVFHRFDLLVRRVLTTDSLHLGQKGFRDVGFHDHDSL